MLFDTLDGGAVAAFYFPKFCRWRFEVRDAAGRMVQDGTNQWGGRIDWQERDRSGTAYYRISDRF
jgi:hypothetical protein